MIKKDIKRFKKSLEKFEKDVNNLSENTGTTYELKFNEPTGTKLT